MTLPMFVFIPLVLLAALQVNRIFALVHYYGWRMAWHRLMWIGEQEANAREDNLLDEVGYRR